MPIPALTNAFAAVRMYLLDPTLAPNTLSVLQLYSPVIGFDVASHINAGVDRPPILVDREGPSILISVRGPATSGGGVNYPSTHWEVSVQVRCFAATSSIAVHTLLGVCADLNDKHGGKIKQSILEAPPQVITDDKPTNWYIAFCFFAMKIRM